MNGLVCKKILVTGSSGHLGEVLVRTLQAAYCELVGIDIEASPSTTAVGSMGDRPSSRPQ